MQGTTVPVILQYAGVTSFPKVVTRLLKIGSDPLTQGYQLIRTTRRNHYAENESHISIETKNKNMHYKQ
jgi:hypothetical protein